MLHSRGEGCMQHSSRAGQGRARQQTGQGRATGQGSRCLCIAREEVLKRWEVGGSGTADGRWAPCLLCLLCLNGAVRVVADWLVGCSKIVCAR